MKHRKQAPAIVAHDDRSHITYRRSDGFAAYADARYFSADLLGYFETQNEAQTAIDNHYYELLLLTHGCSEAALAQTELAADMERGTARAA